MSKFVSNIGRHRFSELVSRFTLDSSNPDAKVILTDELGAPYGNAVRIIKVRSSLENTIGNPYGTVWAIQVDSRTSQGYIVAGSGIIVAFENGLKRNVADLLCNSFFGKPICYHKQIRTGGFHAVPSTFGGFCRQMWHSIVKYPDDPPLRLLGTLEVLESGALSAPKSPEDLRYVACFDRNGHFSEEYKRQMDLIAQANSRFIDERKQKTAISILDEATLADLICEDVPSNYFFS